MSSKPNRNCFIFVVDTDNYAGNFERQMCAFMTGMIGDCEVAEDEADIFADEYDSDVTDMFYDIILQVPDEHECYRPVSIWPTPGYGNSGLGKHEKLTEENKAMFPYPAYMSVAIFFTERPPQKIIDIMKKRAKEYVELHKKERFGSVVNITGYRLIKHDVKVEETEEAV